MESKVVLAEALASVAMAELVVLAAEAEVLAPVAMAEALAAGWLGSLVLESMVAARISHTH
jgi:hypothetical protein